MIRFGKSASALLAHKKSFFSDNADLVAKGKGLAALYAAQPRRQLCKCCEAGLGPAAFEKTGIQYSICTRCGHLNGLHEDSDEFCAALYSDAGGKEYAKNYSAADREAYEIRVRDIYGPKAQFLRDALATHSVPEKMSYVDFGAGSGYFVAAMRSLGLNARGYEVGETQVALADAQLGPGSIECHELKETAALAGNTEADVVSMIGVLEHLQTPRVILRALKDNPRVRYLFISVPLFSPCVFFELVFPGVFQRQLAGGHTHLFTERSLSWLCDEFALERVAEWWFGTDAMDLFRSVSVEIEAGSGSPEAAGLWREMFLPALDAVQLALDERRLASEVHMLLKFSR